MIARALVLAAVAIGARRAAAVSANAGKHYKPHEPVVVIANKVGPFNNPSETYQYFSLPFCRSAGKQKKHHDFGESLMGDRKVRARSASTRARARDQSPPRGKI